MEFKTCAMLHYFSMINIGSVLIYYISIFRPCRFFTEFLDFLTELRLCDDAERVLFKTEFSKFALSILF